jgi:hypothetical protein
VAVIGSPQGVEAGNDHLLEGEWEKPDSIDVRLQSQVGRVPHVDTRVADGTARGWAGQREGRGRGSWPADAAYVVSPARAPPKTKHGKVNRGGPRGALALGQQR